MKFLTKLRNPENPTAFWLMVISLSLLAGAFLSIIYVQFSLEVL